MKNYDPAKPSKYIRYLDENNLNGWGMSQYLPYCEFRWLTQEKINNVDVNSIKGNSPIGYILEVDLKYPDELRELHDDYPLAPEKLAIPHEMFSNYVKKLLIKLIMYSITEIFSCICL